MVVCVLSGRFRHCVRRFGPITALSCSTGTAKIALRLDEAIFETTLSCTSPSVALVSQSGLIHLILHWHEAQDDGVPLRDDALVIALRDTVRRCTIRNPLALSELSVSHYPRAKVLL